MPVTNVLVLSCVDWCANAYMYKVGGVICTAGARKPNAYPSLLYSAYYYMQPLLTLVYL